MAQYRRIFITAVGGFRDSTKYEFVAEFADQEATTSYIRYMRGKQKFAGKDIIVKVIDGDGVNPNEGWVDGVITSLGEELRVEEFDFV